MFGYEDPSASTPSKPIERPVYNGKRTRKHIERRSVDYYSPMLMHRLNRFVRRGFSELPEVSGRRADAVRQMLPPISWEFNASTSLTTKFFHTSTNQERHPINVVKWTPDGRRLLTGASSGEFTLWNGFSFNFETILQAHKESVRCMEWTHNGNWMLSGDREGYLKYWQNNMNNVHSVKAHEKELRDLTFAPSDRKFATCSDDQSHIKIWDFSTCKEERTLLGHGFDVRTLHWHYQKAMLFSGSKDSHIKIWDPRSTDSNKACFQTLHGHKAAISQIRLNRNGNFLVSAARDNLIKIWDLRMMKELRTLRRHTAPVLAVQWHPVHETMLVSGGAEGTMIFWDSELDEPRSILENAHDSSVFSLDWHPLGHILSSGSNDHHTKFWIRHRPGDDVVDRAPPSRFSQMESGGMGQRGSYSTSSESGRPYRNYQSNRPNYQSSYSHSGHHGGPPSSSGTSYSGAFHSNYQGGGGFSRFGGGGGGGNGGGGHDGGGGYQHPYAAKRTRDEMSSFSTHSTYIPPTSLPGLNNPT